MLRQYFSCVQNREGKYQCGCFYAHGTVRLVDGGHRSIANLKPGDQVWSLDEYGNLIEDEIVLLAHVEPDKAGRYHLSQEYRCPVLFIRNHSCGQ